VTMTSAQRAHSVTVRLAPERAPAQVSAAAPGAAAVRQPAAPADAPLTVESRPQGATVVIDGRPVGTTPLVVPAVSAGEHAVQLELEGYKRWSSSIRVVTTERNRVTASLDR
jgi:PEGA domain-containing protein